MFSMFYPKPETLQEAIYRFYACGDKKEDIEFFQNLEELHLDSEGFLVDSTGIRYKRNTPAATIDVKFGISVEFSERDKIRQKILNLNPRPDGFVEIGNRTNYAKVMLPYYGPDNETIIREPREVPIEIYTIELYNLGE